MQLTQGYTDTTPPTITVTRNVSTYIINSTETLWNNAPFVALQYSNGTYTNMAATPVGNNLWTVTVSNSGSLAKVGVAASDLYGNPALLTFSPLTPPTSPIPELLLFRLQLLLRCKFQFMVSLPHLSTMQLTMQVKPSTESKHRQASGHLEIP